ncbi:MAG: chemotaxis protein CheX [Vicinamibacterales bacterium]
MSSTKSVQGPLPAELLESLVQATTSVCETSLFAFTELATAGVVEQIGGEPRWFRIVVAFDGPTHGCVTVSVPQPLAIDLFSAFLGFDETDVFNNAELHDMLGELGNMICGTWLTALGSRECFELAHADVSIVERPALDGDGVVMAVNDRPFVVRVAIEQGAL